MIDFEAFLTFMPSCSVGTVELGGLVGDSRSSTCPLCRIIVACAKEVLASVAVHRWDEISISGKSSKVPGSDHLRTSRVGPAYRLQLVASLQVSNVGWRQVLIGALDMCEESYVVPNQDHRFAMFRRPRHSEFRPEMLRSWLQEHCQPSPRTSRGVRFGLTSSLVDSTDDPLHGLISSGQFRLLDIVNREIIKVSMRERSLSLSYIALSYVWGGSDCVKAKVLPGRTHTFNDYGHVEVVCAVNFDQLPRTIRDAALLVEQLDQRYLWVDGLCIEQDNPSHKASVISYMDSIYRMAYLTIVAGNGRGAEAGLIRLADGRCLVEQPIGLEQGGKSFYVLPALPGLEAVMERAEWNGRGWTFQERELSTACVYFTDEEVFFSTQGVIEREAYCLTPMFPDIEEDGKRVKRTGKSVTTQDVLSRTKNGGRKERLAKYKQAVEDYSRRTLSDARDRLDAFSGVLVSLMQQDQLNSDTVALSGLFYIMASREDQSPCHPFGASLLWDSDEPVRIIDRIEHNAMKTRALPSWSWVGWFCCVNFPKVEIPKFAPTVLDETNIRCDDHHPNRCWDWPYRPIPRKIAIDKAFVLHLWLPITELRLMRNPYYGKELRSKIQEAHGKFHVFHPATDQIVGRISIAEDFIARNAADSLYEFLCLGNKNMLFIRAKGDYYERIALGSWNIAGEVMKLPKPQHVMLI